MADLPPLDDTGAAALVLTPNHRTARQLQEDWGRRRVAAGLAPVFPTPPILPVDLWIRRAWESLLYAGRTPAAHLLEPVHELLLWKQVIERSPAGHAFLNLEAAARQVREAHTLMRQWEISVEEMLAFAHAHEESPADTEIFLDWLDAHERHCRQHRLLGLSDLIPLCIAALEDGRLQPPGPLLLSGFHQPPPLYQRLFDALTEASPHASQAPAPEFLALTMPRDDLPGAALRKVAVPDATHELEAAARWARDVLRNEPEARIGVVCPDLSQRAPAARRIFSGVLTPAAAWRDDGSAQPFTLSAGETLDVSPLAHAALAILSLNAASVDVLEFCQLLRSPFLAAADAEADARAELEYRLRRQEEARASLADLRFLAAREERPWHCPVLARGLMTLESLRREARGKRPPGDWIEVLERQLDALGWPGERIPDPRERAAQTGWYEVLASLPQLIPFTGEVEYAALPALLRSLLRHTALPTGDRRAPVRILSPVEAEGLRFTHLWIMGLSEQQWPPAARPNPFIPLALQRRHAVPEADPGLHAARAEQQLRALLAAATQEVVLSRPCRDENGELAPAAAYLAADGEETSLVDATPAPGLHPELHALLGSAALEIQRAADRIAFDAALEPATGGISLLASQSNCPFRGFAVHRLDARELGTPTLGLSPAARGELLHAALQTFWTTLQNQRALLALDDSALDQHLDEAIDAALRECARRRPRALGPRLRELEAERLRRLLRQWMACERERGCFEVAHVEHEVHWRHAELELRFRIDRVERYEDGTLGLVDYKSGVLSGLRWDEERPENPQLPLYLLAVEDQMKLGRVNALLFARVNIEDCVFRGITARPGICEGQEVERQKSLPEGSSWNTLREHWRDTLQALADEFIAGRHAVQPLGRAACTYCHLDALCRIAEQQAIEDAE